MPSIDTSASWIHVPQATEEKVIKLPQKMEETDMATAVKADALEILKGKCIYLLYNSTHIGSIDPVYSIARLRVGDDGSFYDAGPSAQPLNVPPTPAFRNGSSYLSISPQSASSEASTSKLPDSTKEPSLESNNAAQEPESAQEQSIQRDKRRKEKFLDCLCKETVDLGALRKLAWKGIPNELRPMVWQLLLVSCISVTRLARLKLFDERHTYLHRVREECLHWLASDKNMSMPPIKLSPGVYHISISPYGTRSILTCHGRILESRYGLLKPRRDPWSGYYMSGLYVIQCQATSRVSMIS